MVAAGRVVRHADGAHLSSGMVVLLWLVLGLWLGLVGVGGWVGGCGGGGAGCERPIVFVSSGGGMTWHAWQKQKKQQQMLAYYLGRVVEEVELRYQVLPGLYFFVSFFPGLFVAWGLDIAGGLFVFFFF